MCLTLREKNSRKPWNKKRLRWKMAKLDCNGLRAFYQSTPYEPGKWMQAKGNPAHKRCFGFHVMTERKHLMYGTEARHWYDRVHLLVEVKGFLRSGHYNAAGPDKCETWNQMRIVKVIYPWGCCNPKVKLPRAKPARS